MNKHLIATLYKKDMEIEKFRDRHLNSIAELDGVYKNLEINQELMQELEKENQNLMDNI